MTRDGLEFRAEIKLRDGRTRPAAVISHSKSHDLALLHVNYGQRTQARELRAFTAIADHYGVLDDRRLVTDLDHLRRIGGTSLIDTAREVETGEPDPSRIPSTRTTPLQTGRTKSWSWSSATGVTRSWSPPPSTSHATG